MYQLHGGCHCGAVRLEAQLTRAPGDFNPRACDCDFCRKHGAAYLSDPGGSLAILLRSADQLRRYRQGNELAEMLLCRDCGVLLGALYAAEAQVYGVVNVRALDEAPAFGAQQPVSPRKLDAAGKIRRWREIWFPQVIVRS